MSINYLQKYLILHLFNTLNKNHNLHIKDKISTNQHIHLHISIMVTNKNTAPDILQNMVMGITPNLQNSFFYPFGSLISVNVLGSHNVMLQGRNDLRVFIEILVGKEVFSRINQTQASMYQIYETMLVW